MTKNITLALDEAVLDRARVIAAERKTTVNAMVRDFLTEIATANDRRAQVRQQLRDLMENSTGRLGPDYKWSREETYEDRMFPRHEHPPVRRDGEAG
jgi:Family of unknown function (DUF6364)